MNLFTAYQNAHSAGTSSIDQLIATRLLAILIFPFHFFLFTFAVHAQIDSTKRENPIAASIEKSHNKTAWKNTKGFVLDLKMKSLEGLAIGTIIFRHSDMAVKIMCGSESFVFTSDEYKAIRQAPDDLRHLYQLKSYLLLPYLLQKPDHTLTMILPVKGHDGKFYPAAQYGAAKSRRKSIILTDPKTNMLYGAIFDRDVLLHFSSYQRVNNTPMLKSMTVYPSKERPRGDKMPEYDTEARIIIDFGKWRTANSLDLNF